MGYDLVWTPKRINITYRALVLKGFSYVEAGNLIATLMGLEPMPKGWKPDELKQLLFFRYLNEKQDLEVRLIEA